VMAEAEALAAFEAKIGKNHIAEILPHLFLGDMEAARALVNSNGSPLGITHMINMSDRWGYSPYGTKVVLENIPLRDCGGTRITQHLLEKCFTWVDNALKENANRVLIHCQMGVNRSAMITVGYLMTRHKMRLQTALTLVEGKRQVLINEVYTKALEDLDKGTLPQY